jgi:response regulator RpfG family c-di-GMP phosphodiesterase
LIACREKEVQMPEQSNELNSTPATILVVDDDEAIRKFVSAYLNSKGYHILTADSGEKACKYHGPMTAPSICFYRTFR